MSSIAISFVVVICCCLSATIGIILHIKMPDSHFDSDSKDVVKSVMAIVATMTALVLGLLIASAKSSYDTQSTEIQQLAANVVQLDRFLVLYGPEAGDARKLLKRALIAGHDRLWPEDNHQTVDLNPAGTWGYIQVLSDAVSRLSPANDAQRRSQTAALGLLTEIYHARMLMFEQTSGVTSWPLLVVLIFWVSMLFLGFGLFARVHIIIVGALFIGAVSVGSAIFLMLEMSQPYQGLIRIPDTAVKAALAQMSN
jgi:hypothetical protein